MSYAVQAEFKRVTRDSMLMATEIVERRGVPVDIDAALDMSTDVFRYTTAARRGLVTVQENLLTEQHGGLAIARPRRYPMTATIKLIHRCAGLMPGAPMTTEARYFDPETQKMTRGRISPWVMPELPETRDAFRARLAAGVARHIKSVANHLVIDTAHKSKVRGDKVGWARTLAGSENCAFCAMLASRGAVYSEETADFRTHDNCDCSATIVRPRREWDGQEEAENLRALWDKSKGLTDFSKRLEALRDEQ